MIVLGIESSCDESAVALLEIDRTQKPKILFEAIASQVDLHAQYGGVVPELAAREHLRSLPILLDRALVESGLSASKIDLVGVTQGPGLKGCLLIGIEFAKGFCIGQNLPLYGVNHIEGHIHAAKLDEPALKEPFIALVVSGGHTEIVRVRANYEYAVLSRTIDDAAGEAFDKSANLLGFEYPGGARLAALADSVDSSRFILPKVMRESEGFSFSGLKTAISLLIRRQKETLSDETIRAELAFAIQESIIDSLLYKLKRELEKEQVTAITVTGGVACNKRLRQKIKDACGLPVYFPNVEHCVDNAAMIALVAGLKYKGSSHKMESDLEVLPRWPVEQLNFS